jgi:hypothetical protein
MCRLIYLHGFASSPQSKKARLFEERCKGLGYQLLVPDLAEGDFRGLTISGQLRVVESFAGSGPVAVIGSSMGGYLAALFAAKRPEQVERVVLMAPAFGFARRWAESLGAEKVADWERSGELPVFHYAAGGETTVGWGLMTDARRYEEEPDVRQPALIFHGVKDDVVPVDASRSFAKGRRNVDLREMDSDHELIDVVEKIWAESAKFLFNR